ncbi:putative lipoprotein [Methyloprofundus sp.]|uniref:putative lipoprotein n=1 Tax=Methyloprofundus sp. TaxID=2020875 RepID=UPI003D1476DA
MQNKPFLFPALIIVSLAQGCSFSHSSESSSDSSGSSSTSSGSSSSSKSSKDTEEYQLQVMSYASAYLSTADFDRFAFSRGISQIATANGITNWEDDDATMIAIGRALKKSNITGSAYESYKDKIANSDKDRMELIQKGYEMNKD